MLHGCYPSKKLQKSFGSSEKRSTFASAIGKTSTESEKCGNSSVGRAQPCQGWGREFEPRFPLKRKKSYDKRLPRWRNGRRARFRCECWETCKFESCSGHDKDKISIQSGGMAELVDALLWGGSDSIVVWVRVSFPSLRINCGWNTANCGNSSVGRA